MKINFGNLFKIKVEKENSENVEEINDSEIIEIERKEHDNHVKFYYTNIINSLILHTYNTKELDKMVPVLIDPLAELYEELDYAFLPVLFETVFRNRLIDESFKQELLDFKKKVDEIPGELWDWEILDTNEIWKDIRTNAETLLNKLNIESRAYNEGHTTIIFKK